MAEGLSFSGTTLLASVLLADKPADADATVLSGGDVVLLTITLRKPADMTTLQLGLSADQTLQLIERLSAHADECRLAVAEGHGGARFVDSAE